MPWSNHHIFVVVQAEAFQVGVFIHINSKVCRKYSALRQQEISFRLYKKVVTRCPYYGTAPPMSICLACLIRVMSRPRTNQQAILLERDLTVIDDSEAAPMVQSLPAAGLIALIHSLNCICKIQYLVISICVAKTSMTQLYNSAAIAILSLYKSN